MNNLFSVNANRFLVTGAGSGIGRTTAILLSDLGASLALIDKDSEGLRITASKCKSEVDIFVFDLSIIQEIPKLIENILEKWEYFDGFAHIAGISYISPLSTMNYDVYNEVMRINAYSAVEIMKIISKRKYLCKTSQLSCVLVSSIYGLVGTAANCGYAMSKASLHGLTKALSVELASKNIRVNCIAPGFIKTTMMDKNIEYFDNNYIDLLNNLHPLGLGNPLDIAYGILYLLSKASKWITGIILPIDGGYTAK